jgi:hypothetical protein
MTSRRLEIRRSVFVAVDASRGMSETATRNIPDPQSAFVALVVLAGAGLALALLLLGRPREAARHHLEPAPAIGAGH